MQHHESGEKLIVDGCGPIGIDTHMLQELFPSFSSIHGNVFNLFNPLKPNVYIHIEFKRVIVHKPSVMQQVPV